MLNRHTAWRLNGSSELKTDDVVEQENETCRKNPGQTQLNPPISMLD
jgi:hypothetical protein